MKKIPLLVILAAILVAGCGQRQVKEESQSTSETTVSEKQEGTKSEVTEEKKVEVLLTLAAAASLKNTFDEVLIPEFEKAHPEVKIQAVYDSSGKLQKQIEEGLEADVFMSAASKQMRALVEGGYVEEATVVDLLENKLVLIQHKEVEDKVTSFDEVISEKIDVLALGNPETTPAGQYAKGVFENLGIWEQVTPKLSLAGNVTEVLNWVELGSAKAGIVYATDAKKSREVVVVANAPEEYLAQKVVYPIAPLVKSAHSDEAKALVEFLQSEFALKTFEDFGFTILDK